MRRGRVWLADGDGVHPVAQAALTSPVGQVRDDVLRAVCSAASRALG